jgi:hypothetical protein
MKAVNFGIVYGTTALGLAGRQGWTFSFAEDLLQLLGRPLPKGVAAAVRRPDGGQEPPANCAW